MTPTDKMDAATLSRQTVNHIVDRWPQTMPVFRRYGVDMCCGGWMTVQRAAVAAGVPEEELCAALLAVLDPGAARPSAVPPAGAGDRV